MSGSFRERRARTARFVVVGLLGTAFYYAALVAMVEVMRIDVLASSCIAFALVVGSNYALHRSWTFRSPVEHRRALLPFVAMSVAGFGINTGVMAAGLASGIHYLLVQALAIVLVVSWNFIFTTLIFSQPALVNPPKGSHHGPA